MNGLEIAMLCLGSAMLGCVIGIGLIAACTGAKDADRRQEIMNEVIHKLLWWEQTH